MKQKSGFIEEKVGDFFYLYPILGDGDGKIFSMNDTCKYVWDLLKADLSESQLITSVATHYGVESDIVSEDIKEIISQMYNAGVIEM